MIRKLLYGIFLSLLLTTLTAQTFAASDTNGPVPFVSRINAVPAPGEIVITWKYEDGFSGTQYLYRYTEEITSENFSEATLIATLENLENSYIDRPDDDQSYFYLLLIEIDGERKDLFIEFRNKTVLAAAKEEIIIENYIAEVTNLSAVSEQNHLLIQFDVSDPERELVLYRSIEPIITEEDLVEAHLVAIISGETSYIDYGVPGIKYYYALIDSEEIKIGNVSFKPGINSLTDPVLVPLSELASYSLSDTRDQPLPYLLLAEKIDNSEYILPSLIDTLPYTMTLSGGAAVSINTILAMYDNTDTQAMKAELLTEETLSESYGDDFLLKQIISNYFSRALYDETILAIQDFLSVNRDKKAEARARFYLGQCYYFTKQYRKSVMEFILAEDYYYVECSPWIDTLLAREL